MDIDFGPKMPSQDEIRYVINIELSRQTLGSSVIMGYLDEMLGV